MYARNFDAVITALPLLCTRGRQNGFVLAGMFANVPVLRRMPPTPTLVVLIQPAGTMMSPVVTAAADEPVICTWQSDGSTTPSIWMFAARSVVPSLW